MKVVLNGSNEIFLQPMTLRELIEVKGWDPDKIVAELNLEIISKNSWANIVLAENDRLEILSFMGGGTKNE
ncbi:MAG: sulfur carrier protein ThiS [Deltaproteobacteria bacterium]|nr:sulfur carrier protein ThiS [Deltaproteobacteria bacterium]